MDPYFAGAKDDPRVRVSSWAGFWIGLGLAAAAFFAFAICQPDAAIVILRGFSRFALAVILAAGQGLWWTFAFLALAIFTR
jgi:hypothetical protein